MENCSQIGPSPHIGVLKKKHQAYPPTADLYIVDIYLRNPQIETSESPNFYHNQIVLYHQPKESPSNVVAIDFLDVCLSSPPFNLTSSIGI